MKGLSIIICILAVAIIALAIIFAIILFNSMMLISTLNKRLVAIIGDILGDVDLSTPRISTLTNDTGADLSQLEEMLDDNSGEGFNPHNFDPFKEENNN